MREAATTELRTDAASDGELVEVEIVGESFNQDAIERIRVQKNYDLTTASGEQIQVRYLANPLNRWINEHHVDFRSPCDRYALLIVEDFEAKALIVFTRSTIGAACSALGKRHPNQEIGLALTRRNYLQLRAEPERFALLGVQVVSLD